MARQRRSKNLPAVPGKPDLPDTPQSDQEAPPNVLDAYMGMVGNLSPMDLFQLGQAIQEEAGRAVGRKNPRRVVIYDQGALPGGIRPDRGLLPAPKSYRQCPNCRTMTNAPDGACHECACPM